LAPGRAEAQNLAGHLYGTCFQFLANGSTCGVHQAIVAAFGHWRARIILHETSINRLEFLVLILSKPEFNFLSIQSMTQIGMYQHHPRIAAVLFKQHPDAKAVMVVYHITAFVGLQAS
jgi:hypothetical protein